jgi:hypothetical protein
MNLENVKPLDLSGHLGKAKERVALVGVELEGGWIELPAGAVLEHDGSVFRGANGQQQRPPGVKHIGEIHIGPAPVKGISELLRRNYPPKIHSTCGMHVHMSFESLYYYHLLMVAEYQETVLHYLIEWAKKQEFGDKHYIWPRLRGESQFCQKKFWPDAQAQAKRKGHDQQEHGHRYTAIHYCAPRPGKDPTIECRVLPMMQKAPQAASAIQHLVDITNACIAVLGAKAKRTKASGRVTLDNNMTYEETIIEVMDK